MRASRPARGARLPWPRRTAMLATLGNAPMTEINPLLRDDEFVAYSEIRPEHVLPAVQARIAQYHERIEARVGFG